MLFYQVIMNDQDFLVVIAFCLVSSPLTVRCLRFSLTGLVTVCRKTLHNYLGKLTVGSSSSGTKWFVKFTKNYPRRHSVKKGKQTNHERLKPVACLFYIEYTLTNAY